MFPRLRPKTDKLLTEVDALLLGAASVLLYISRMHHLHADTPVRLDGLAAARDFFASCLAESDPAKERIWVAHLDQGSNCLRLTHHDGDRHGVDFPLRSIIADAASCGSSAILIAHNHPSGDPMPSEGDRRATRRLACAAEALDCCLLDHIVFGGSNYSSFRAMGLL